jgi:hypothetical protein
MTTTTATPRCTLSACTESGHQPSFLAHRLANGRTVAAAFALAGRARRRRGARHDPRRARPGSQILRPTAVGGKSSGRSGSCQSSRAATRIRARPFHDRVGVDVEGSGRAARANSVASLAEPANLNARHPNSPIAGVLGVAADGGQDVAHPREEHGSAGRRLDPPDVRRSSRYGCPRFQTWAGIQRPSAVPILRRGKCFR